MDVFDDVFMIDTNIQQAIRLDVQVIFFSLNLIVKKHLFGAAYALGFLTCHRLWRIVTLLADLIAALFCIWRFLF